MELREQLQQTLGHAYTLERELGGGGMSRVFLARDQALERPVVVKVLPTELAAAVSIERFKREIRLAASLQQANIVPVLSAGDADGVPYYTMPFVKGESLRSLLAAKGKLSIGECIAILRDVARALAFAHEEGVVHRDIKPENILLSGGTAMVTDFGIAKALVASSTQGGATTLTQLGIAIGTPAYMAPEQAVGEAVDHRADLYSLGVVAYEMLSGQAPFAGRSAQAMLAAHAIEAPEPIRKQRPEAPPGLADLVSRCLAKEQRDRPPSASAMLEALETVSSPQSAYAALESARSQTDEKSLAVLPLVNTTRDPENEYFSDGLTEELINVLGRLAGLRVTARTSAFAMKGTERDAREIGRTLNVGSLLEGSVRRSGSRVRVSLQLIESSSGQQIWSDRYDHELTDLFALQDEIARVVADRLKVELGIDQQPARERATNVQAYDAFLRGRFSVSKMTLEGCERAIEHFERAIEIDPEYARAHAAMAEALVNSVVCGADPKQRFPIARRHADRALALSPALSEAHGIDAYIAFWHELDWDRAEHVFLHALELDPGSTTTRYQYAVHLANLGRPEDAAAHARRLIELDPLWPNAHQTLGYAQYVAGEFKDALVSCDRALELSPAHFTALWTKGMTQLELGMYDTAAATFEAQLTESSFDAWWLSQLAITYARMRRPTDVRRVLDRIERIASPTAVSDGVLVFAYAWAGDIDRAIAQLEQAIAARSQYVAGLPTFCGYDPLRRDPRFERLFDQLRFPRWARAFADKRRARMTAIAAADDKPSIAVLPFTNLSPDAADAYFSDGFADEIITDLSGIHSLRVIAAASMARYRATDKDPETVARELGVRYVLSGTLRRAGQSLRLTARLIDAHDGTTRWTDKVSGTVEQLFQLQEQVSKVVVHALKLQLTPIESARLGDRAASPTRKAAAIEAYLEGMHFHRQATADGLLKARERFERATEIDGEFAQAYAKVAQVIIHLTTAWHALSPRDAMPRAKAAAMRAADLDPSLPEAHLALGLVASFYEWDLRAADRAFTEALRLSPNYAEGHAFYAVPLIWLDIRFNEAADHARRAVELNPLDPWARFQLILAHYFGRDYDRALVESERLLEREPLWGLGHYTLGFVQATAGKPSLAVASLNRAIDLDGRGVHIIAWLGASHAIAGDEDAARRCLEELDAQARAGKSVWAWKLCVHAALAQHDEVIDCLEHAYDERSSSLIFHFTHPICDPVRTTQRFADLLGRMGLGHLATYRPVRPWQSRLRLRA